MMVPVYELLLVHDEEADTLSFRNFYSKFTEQLYVCKSNKNEASIFTSFYFYFISLGI